MKNKNTKTYRKKEEKNILSSHHCCMNLSLYKYPSKPSFSKFVSHSHFQNSLISKTLTASLKPVF